MADPLGAIALIVDLGPKFIKYGSAVRSASADRQKLLTEILTTIGILSIVKDALTQSSTENGWAAEVLNYPGMGKMLHEVSESLQDMANKLEPKKGLASKIQILKWPFLSDEIGPVLTRIERCKAAIILALQLGNAEGIASLKAGQDKLVEYQEREQSDKLISWLSTYPHWAKHAHIARRRVTGTSEWILGDPVFKKWHSGDLDTLVLYGGPGIGKTFLVSSIIDHIEVQRKNRSAVSLAFIYFDDSERQIQTSETILSSLTRQLIKDKPAHFHKLQALHESTNIARRDRPSIEDTQELLKGLVMELEVLYVVFDAFDESRSRETQEGVADLVVLLQGTGCQTKVLITSRSSPSSIDRFTNAEKRHLRASDSDIRTYVKYRAATERFIKRHIDSNEGLLHVIIATIVARCHGMFLLAQLYIDSLRTARTLTDLEDTLAGLPAGVNRLNDTYTNVVSRLFQQDQRDAILAKRILTWICFSSRPLTVDELRYALAVDPNRDQPNLDEKRLLPADDISSLCSSIVTVNHSTREVRLVHFTAQEYFNANRNRLFPRAHESLARTCIKFLSYKTFELESRHQSEVDINKFKDRYPFLQYAAESFGYHSIEAGQIGVDEIVQLFRSQPHLDCINQIRHGWVNNCSDKFLTSPLSTAVDYDLVDVVKKLLDDGIDVNDGGAMNYLPANAAAFYGKPQMLELLLDRADSSLPDHWGSTLLHVLSYRNLIEEVKVVLAKRTSGEESLSQQNFCGSTPLHDAVREGHEIIVPLLVNAGIDVRLNDYWKKSVIQIAVMKHDDPGLCRRMTEVVLPAYKNDFDFEDGCGFTLLHATAGVDMVLETRQIIQKRPALLEKRDVEMNTPLSIAVIRNSLATFQVLLKHGANIRVNNVHQRSPLHEACLRGHTEMVQALIEAHSPDFANQDDFGVAPLAAAAAVALHSEMRMILEACPEVIDLTNKFGSTAMHDAAQREQAESIRILLQYGAEIDKLNHEGCTALACAVEVGDTESVLVLLDAGADPSINPNGDPLPVRAGTKPPGLLKALLAHPNFDYSLRNGNGVSALHQAASFHDENALLLIAHDLAQGKLLLDQTNNRGCTALHEAAERGRMRVVERLLEAGADATITNHVGKTAFDCAFGGGFLDIASLLQPTVSP